MPDRGFGAFPGTGLPALSGKCIIYVRKGRVIAAKWPRKRTRRETKKIQPAVTKFTAALEVARWAADMELKRAMEITAGTMLYPRDVIVKAMYGLFLEAELTDGSRITRYTGTQESDVMHGARITRTSNYSPASGSNVQVPFEQADFDTDGLWSATQPSKLTVPAGYSYARVEAGWLTTANASGTTFPSILMNGVTNVGAQGTTASGTREGTITSGAIPVSPGDTFELNWYSTWAATLAADERTYLSIQLYT